MLGLLKSLLGLGSTILDRVLPNRKEVAQAQARINEQEIAGAPVSRLRLWRSFLGWVLALGFLWELMRPVLLHYRPELNLPPSAAREITTLLFGHAGVGILIWTPRFLQ